MSHLTRSFKLYFSIVPIVWLLLLWLITWERILVSTAEWLISIILHNCQYHKYVYWNRPTVGVMLCLKVCSFTICPWRFRTKKKKEKKMSHDTAVLLKQQWKNIAWQQETPPHTHISTHPKIMTAVLLTLFCGGHFILAAVWLLGRCSAVLHSRLHMYTASVQSPDMQEVPFLVAQS